MSEPIIATNSDIDRIIKIEHDISYLSFKEAVYTFLINGGNHDVLSYIFTNLLGVRLPISDQNMENIFKILSDKNLVVKAIYLMTTEITISNLSEVSKRFDSIYNTYRADRYTDFHITIGNTEYDIKFDFVNNIFTIAEKCSDGTKSNGVRSFGYLANVSYLDSDTKKALLLIESIEEVCVKGTHKLLDKLGISLSEDNKKKLINYCFRQDCDCINLSKIVKLMGGKQK